MPTKTTIAVPHPPALGQRALYIDHYFEPPHSLYHFHSTFELVFTQGSSGERIVGDNATPFRPEGDLLLIGPHIPHTWTPDAAYRSTDDRCPVENIVVHFTRESLGLELLGRSEMAPLRQLLREAEKGVDFAPAA